MLQKNGSSLVLFSVTLWVVICSESSAATIRATALTPKAVQAAIHQAVDGDTVLLPAGSAEWGSTVTVTGKGISIVGAGADSTIIMAGSGISSGSVFDIHSLGVKNFSLSGMHLIGSTAGATVNIGGNSERSTNFRLHDLTLTVNKRGIIVQGRNDGGVIDHCTFICTLNDSCQGVTVFGDAGYVLVPGNTAASFPPGTSWARGLTLGTSEMVFIEDNVFKFDYCNDAAIEGYQGARFVVRHNTIYNAQVGAHGLDSTISGTHSYEIYDNTHIVENIPNHKLFVEFRSGTGVVYNNNQVVDWLPARYAPGWAMGLISYRTCGDHISYNFKYRGSSTGESGSTVLNSASATWKPGQFVSGQDPYTIWNRTDGSIGRITANTATTITAMLTGGVDNLWDNGDEYSISSQQGGMQTGINPYDGNAPVDTGSGKHDGPDNASVLADSTKSWMANQFVSPIQHTIWNLKDGSYGRITANTATTVTAHMIGGKVNNWNAGDSYTITNGYPGLEQVGWTGPVTLNQFNSEMTPAPIYEWNNTLNGSATESPTTGLIKVGIGPGDDSILKAQGQVRPYPSDAIQENRDYYVNTVKPGYKAYTYPHPSNSSKSRSDHCWWISATPATARTSRNRDCAWTAMPPSWRGASMGRLSFRANWMKACCTPLSAMPMRHCRCLPMASFQLSRLLY